MSNSEDSRPNLFVVGAAKCGTTSMVRYLGQHPDIFVPPTKEPNFHVAQTVGLSNIGPVRPERLDHQLHRYSKTTRETYEGLYRGRSERVRIDGSVRNLYLQPALARIAEECPDASYVVVIRHPVDRIVSHWKMNRQYHLEPLKLPDAMRAEEERKRLGWGFDWHYLSVSQYADQLRALYQLVPDERVLVVFYGDFLRTPLQVLDAICEFVGVELGHRFDLSESGMVPVGQRIPALDRFITLPNPGRSLVRRVPKVGPATLERLHRWNETSPPVVPDDYREVVERYTADVLADLAGLLGREPSDLEKVVR